MRRLAIAGALALVAAALVASTPSPSRAVMLPTPSPYAGCAPVGVTGGEWRTYGADLANTRHQTRERAIAHADVPFLRPAWTFSSVAAGGSGDFTGTPIVADGCVYVGSNRGWVFSMNADTGEPVWAAQVPEGGVINSTVAVHDGLVIAGISRPTPGAGPYIAAFHQATGALAWASDPLDSQVGADTFATPIVYDGMVIMGISGAAAEIGDESDRYAFQGSTLLLDVTTGDVIEKIWTIHSPDTVDEFAGGAVWSTPAIDTETGYAYVGTGNPFKPEAEHLHTNAVIKIDLDDTRATFGTIVGAYHGTVDEYVPELSALPCVDFTGNNPPYYPQGLGGCGDIDLDFGASPNLFKDATGRKLVGAGQKSGVYHAFDAATMDGVWTQLLGPPSLVGGIVGSTAYDGQAIYGPVTPGGYQWSVGKNDGGVRWVSPTADGAHYANATAVANGIVYTVDLKGALDAFDARNGAPLLHYPMVLGSGTGANPALSWAGVSVARNTVYTAVGISGLENGFVVAFRPGEVVGTPPVPGVPPLPDDAPGPVALAGPGAFATTYGTPVVVTRVGGPLSFASADLPQHDIVAVDKGPDGSPLFRSPLIGLGQVAPVTGLDQVEAGNTYQFFCSLHPGMKGTLAVV
ncbi:MAG TPA: PQQ-binding-like beta-propeller repeat protein [Acidimicrobiales bacterium]